MHTSAKIPYQSNRRDSMDDHSQAKESQAEPLVGNEKTAKDVRESDKIAVTQVATHWRCCKCGNTWLAGNYIVCTSCNHRRDNFCRYISIKY